MAIFINDWMFNYYLKRMGIVNELEIPTIKQNKNKIEQSYQSDDEDQL